MASTLDFSSSPSSVFSGMTKSLLSSVAITLGDRLTSILGSGTSRVVGGINGSISRAAGGGVVGNILGSTIGNASGGVLYGVASTAVGAYSGTLNESFSRTFSTIQKMSGVNGMGFNIPNLVNSTYSASGDLIAKNLSNALVAAGITPGSASGIAISAGLSGMFNTTLDSDPFASLNPSGHFLPEEIMSKKIDRIFGSGGNLIFPADLGNYWMSLEFGEYSKRSPREPGKINTQGDRIFLPIPHNLADIYQLSWSEQQLGVVGAAMTSGSAGLESIKKQFSDSGGGALGYISAGGQSIVEAIKMVGETGSYALRRNGVPFVNIPFQEELLNAINLATGTVPNPHLALLFNNPTFKTHQFIWKLSPNNIAESDIIRNIIKILKINSSPAKNGGLFLSYPSIVYITLATKVNEVADKSMAKTEAPYLYKFKPCIIESLSVNFNGGGMPSFHSSGAPVEVDLQISFKEIELWFREDMVSLDGTVDSKIERAFPIFGR